VPQSAVLTFELMMFIFVLACVAVIAAMLGPQYYNLWPEESELLPFEDAGDSATFSLTSTSTITSTITSDPSSANYDSTETEMGAKSEAQSKTAHGYQSN
jgi:hypothetical protein